MMLFCDVVASSDLFSLVGDGRVGKLVVNGSLYGMNGRKVTLRVRASYESYYARDLLEGCDCANRSDVFVNIFVAVEPKQLLDFGKGPFEICEFFLGFSRSVSVSPVFPMSKLRSESGFVVFMKQVCRNEPLRWAW